MKKIELGQFFTVKNVFKLQPFLDWFHSIEPSLRSTVLEPFAGKDSIPSLLQAAGVQATYVSYDIEPQAPQVRQQNTLLDFPQNFSCVITNPPYISKVSAARKKMKIEFGTWDDLYEVALYQCLENSQYVAAIIPESFLTTKNLKERLQVYISLPFTDMFSDTEHPVCLALFAPTAQPDFKIYRGEEFVGNWRTLLAADRAFFDFSLYPEKKVAQLPVIKINDAQGQLSLIAIDNTKDEKGLQFAAQGVVRPEEIKISSRARTLISIEGYTVNPKFIDQLNTSLKHYRAQTKDVFLTSFKGVRKDGKFRRRLDFARAKKFVQKALLDSHTF